MQSCVNGARTTGMSSISERNAMKTLVGSKQTNKKTEGKQKEKVNQTTKTNQQPTSYSLQLAVRRVRIIGIRPQRRRHPCCSHTEQEDGVSFAETDEGEANLACIVDGKFGGVS